METLLPLFQVASDADLSADGVHIHEEVGRGTSARVFRAALRFHGIDRPVAMKQFLLESNSVGGGASPSILPWKTEARCLSLIQHSAIPSLIRGGILLSGAPYLLIDWIEGRTLRALRQARIGTAPRPGAAVLPDRVVAYLGCEVLRGLSAVQRALPHLVHHDVNPTNLMVSCGGEVKLLDFGSAEIAGPARGETRGVVRGKVGYMAPECFTGPRVDERADQFSLGVVLYELLAGTRPWMLGPFASETDCMLARKGAPLLDLRPRLDQALARAVERMISFRPAHRFASADEAVRALAPFGAGELGQLRLRSIVEAITAP